MHVIGVLVGITVPLSLQPLALLKKSNVLGLKETINGRSPAPVCLLPCESIICRCESEIASIVDSGDACIGLNVLHCAEPSRSALQPASIITPVYDGR